MKTQPRSVPLKAIKESPYRPKRATRRPSPKLADALRRGALESTTFTVRHSTAGTYELLTHPDLYHAAVKAGIEKVNVVLADDLAEPDVITLVEESYAEAPERADPITQAVYVADRIEAYKTTSKLRFRSVSFTAGTRPCIHSRLPARCPAIVGDHGAFPGGRRFHERQ